AVRGVALRRVSREDASLRRNGFRRPGRSLVGRPRALRDMRRKGGVGLLGFQGVVLRSTDPASLARRLTQLTGLEPLRKSRREIVLGGPELFVVLRRAVRSEAEGLAGLHVGVRQLTVRAR